MKRATSDHPAGSGERAGCGRRRLLRAGAGVALLAAWPFASAFAGPSRNGATVADVDAEMPGDLRARGADRERLRATLARITRVQRTVGHGNFNLLDFDHMLRVGRDYSAVGRFTASEIACMEQLFHFDARRYGFFGEPIFSRLAAGVARRELVGIGGYGQRLLHGAAQARFQRMRARAGDALVLTSGVRSLVKQIHLFLAKAERVDGNLSRASRSLAPPGYSYHAVGDFDVGERGLGAGNFTLAFARTATYRRLLDAGALPMRYPRGNRLGVRFEPWHVRVV